MAVWVVEISRCAAGKIFRPLAAEIVSSSRENTATLDGFSVYLARGPKAVPQGTDWPNEHHGLSICES
jgi:hypothetical protein